VRFGADDVGVRLAVVGGRLPDSALEPSANWPALYDTWDDVVEAQTTQDPQEPATSLAAAAITPSGDSRRRAQRFVGCPAPAR